MQPSPATSRPATLIFGGTFDPPHRAHVDLPRRAACELGCERILYIPAAINPLKTSPDHPPPTPAQHRLAMLRLALRDVPDAEISDIELRRAGPSYTIDTVRALLPSLQGSGPSGLHLLIGADQALDFHRWKQWREIQALAMPAVMLRPPWTLDAFESALRKRYDENEVDLWLDRTLRSLPMSDVNATEIRRRVRAGQPIDDLVQPDVAAYIRTHGLYVGR